MLMFVHSFGSILSLNLQLYTQIFKLSKSLPLSLSKPSSGVLNNLQRLYKIQYLEPKYFVLLLYEIQ